MSKKRSDLDVCKKSSVEKLGFGNGLYYAEPIFTPKLDFDYAPEYDEELGWLLTEVYNGNTKKSFLAIFQAEYVADRPVAKVHLKHHLLLSFHGYWHAMS
ncbi:MAG: carotenoid oxygenase family protein [Candidatus Wukongarchaeota archaeon]